MSKKADYNIVKIKLEIEVTKNGNHGQVDLQIGQEIVEDVGIESTIDMIIRMVKHQLKKDIPANFFISKPIIVSRIKE